MPDLVPARMLNEFAYCPRLAYLEWVQGEFADNLETLEGRFGHRRVDQPDRQEVPEPNDDEPPLQTRRLKRDEAPVPTAQHRDDPFPLGHAFGARREADRQDRRARSGKQRGRADRLQARPRARRAGQCLGARASAALCPGADSPRKRLPVRRRHPVLHRLAAAACRSRSTTTVGRPHSRAARANANDGGRAAECRRRWTTARNVPRCSLVGICLPDETRLLARPDAQPADERRPPADARPRRRLAAVHPGAGRHAGQERRRADGEDRGRNAAEGQDDRRFAGQPVRQRAGHGPGACARSRRPAFPSAISPTAAGSMPSRAAWPTRTSSCGCGSSPSRPIRTQSLGLARQFVLGKIKNCRTLLRRHCRTRQRPRPILPPLARLFHQAKRAAIGRKPAGHRGHGGQDIFRRLRPVAQRRPTISTSKAATAARRAIRSTPCSRSSTPCWSRS